MDEKVIPVEGHSKWLFDLAPYLEERAKPENQYLDSFIARLLKRNEEEVARGNGWNDWATILAHKLNCIAIAILYLDDRHFGTTKLLMQELDELIPKQIRPATDIQRAVIFYLRNVLQWKHAGGKDGDETAQRLNKRWEALLNEGNEVKAMVAFLKGRLALELGMELEKVKAYYMKAIELDPECLAWYNHAYLVVREIRRNEGGPSKMERDLADTAYKICHGKDIIAAANYAIMCKEVWMAKKEHFWGDNHSETFSKCVQHLEEAYKFAHGDWLLKTKIHTADLLYFGKLSELRGLGLLLELERWHPGSTSVVHKIGKRYFKDGNTQEAREFYERASELNPGDVSGVMDLIEWLNLKLGVAEKNDIVRVLRRALLPKFRKYDENEAKLKARLELKKNKPRILTGIH